MYTVIHEFPIPTVVLPFLLLFSMVLSLFYNLVLTGLYEVRLKPRWLITALLPGILLVTWLLWPGVVLYAFIGMFILLILLALIGGIRSGIMQRRKDRQEMDRSGKQKKPLWKRLLGALAALAFVVTFLFSGPYAFLLILVIAFLSALFSSGTRFMRLQASLPTSRIRSMAMGLVEVRGKLIMKDALLSRIDSKPCIGYKYVIEDISKDDDGKESFSTVFSETKCARFFIEDETGKAEVIPEGIELLWMPVTDQYRSAGRRYSQHLLQQDDEVMLIGKADREEEQTVIVREEVKKVFSVSPAVVVDTWNRNKPLLNSLIVFATAAALLIALLLIVPIEHSGNKVILDFSHLGSNIFHWKPNP